MMTKRLRVLIFLIIISAFLTLFLLSSIGGFFVKILTDTIRQIGYVSNLLIQSTDQLLIWISLIIIVIIFAIITINNLRLVKETPKDINKETISPLKRWDHLLRLTHGGIYFKWRLSQQLRIITLETLAHKNGLTLQQANTYLTSSNLEAPKEICDYLLAARNPKMMSDFSTDLKSTKRSTALNTDPELIIHFLEEILYKYPSTGENKV
ncbi:MAG: hypothetical protein PVG14_12880 [Anaerolineales bacterium]|jgi:hypothetical protein